MSTCVYIDGFNLYYGAIRGTFYHWLNLELMCDMLLPNHDITAIRYFSAIVSGRPDDQDKPIRQQIYLRALATLPKVDIHLGTFLSHMVNMPLAVPAADGSRFARVLKTEEKGSDVNLATHLLHDAHMNRFDVAVVISNDSDLLEPIRLVREELNKKVGIINPRGQRPSKVLRQNCDFVKELRRGVLEASQFARTLCDAKGEFSNPFRQASQQKQV